MTSSNLHNSIYYWLLICENFQICGEKNNYFTFFQIGTYFVDFQKLTFLNYFKFKFNVFCGENWSEALVILFRKIDCKFEFFFFFVRYENRKRTKNQNPVVFVAGKTTFCDYGITCWSCCAPDVCDLS